MFVLGIDIGTQSLKGCILEYNEHECSTRLVTTAHIEFSKECATHQYANNVNEIGQVTVNPPMWLEALDLFFVKLKNFDFAKISKISGSAQQHGSVYWKLQAAQQLQNLDPSQSLAQQLDNCFLCPSPIWMDSSTSLQCDQLEASVGGKEKIAQLTGSRAYERFTASQILKRTHLLSKCERISLVSSFLASILIGGYAPIDYSDGSGMNLLDIQRLNWSKECLTAISCQTGQKQDIEPLLGEPVPSNTIIGTISQYFVKRYGFDPQCEIVACSGDNCNSACFALRQVGDICVSLGTSHAVFGFTSQYEPNSHEGHVFVNPMYQQTVEEEYQAQQLFQTKSQQLGENIIGNDLSMLKYMPLCCTKNGGTVRKEIAMESINFVTKNESNLWDSFNEILQTTVPENQGYIGFYYSYPEIAPNTRDKCGIFRLNANNEFVSHFEAKVEIRALVESQFLALKIHARRIGLTNAKRIIATGGASTNPALLQVLANVFGCPVYVATEYMMQHSAALGSALRSLAVATKANIAKLIDKSQLFKLSLIASCESHVSPVYEEMEKRFEEMEALVLEKLGV